MSKFTFHSDPAHGWLEVPVTAVIELGLVPSSFTAYSYQSRDGSVLFLEEDCDAPTFLEAYKAHKGTANLGFDERHYEASHWIRELDRIVSAEELDEIWF